MRGFDKTEYKERVNRALKLMESRNLEMLLVTSPQNFRYFTGLDSYFWESPTRPWFLLLSLKNNEWHSQFSSSLSGKSSLA